MKLAAPFLLKFALASALLLALWPPLSWVYGPLLGSAANAFFALVRPGVSVEVGDGVCLVYHLWPDVLRCEVRDFGAICLNALVATALFAALPGKPKWRRKALLATLLALSATHILCLYLLSYVAVWDAFPGSAQQASFQVLANKVNAAVSHQTALICRKVYALWGAYGWEGLPFLAGALAFLRARGLLRMKRSRPVTRPRPRMRTAPTERIPSARTPRNPRPQTQRRALPLFEQRPHPTLR